MIDVRNVHKSYRSGGRQVDALARDQLPDRSGRFAFIVGPSGSGKSSLLYLLGALDRPTSGEILVDGQDLARMSESQQNAYRRDEIGFIFQSFNLISNLTVLENVLVPFLPRGVTAAQRRAGGRPAGGGRPGRPRSTTAPISSRAASSSAWRSPGRWSSSPRLILADEPTGELDSRTGDEIYTILRRLQESSGTTLVVVTHDRRFITPDDLVLEIQDGQLARSRETEAVAYSAALTGR